MNVKIKKNMVHILKPKKKEEMAGVIKLSKATPKNILPPTMLQFLNLPKGNYKMGSKYYYRPEKTVWDIYLQNHYMFLKMLLNVIIPKWTDIKIKL